MTHDVLVRFDQPNDAGLRRAAGDTVSQVVTWLRANWLWLGSLLGGVAVLLILLGIVLWGVRRPRRGGDATEMAYQPADEPASAVSSSFTEAADPLSPIYASLRALHNGNTTHPIMTDVVRIGRNPENDISVADETVSGYHATIVRRRDGSFVLTDLGSKNGVRVNGEAVDKCLLANGDVIDLGRIRFRFLVNRPGLDPA